MDFLPTDCFVLEDEEAADWFLSSSSSSCYVPFCAEAGAATLKICSGSSSIARTVADFLEPLFYCASACSSPFLALFVQ